MIIPKKAATHAPIKIAIIKRNVPLVIVFMVHFEKALTRSEGIYALINREFAKNAAAGFRYINRQEDIGEEGLRKAKLSYYPERLGLKITVTLA